MVSALFIFPIYEFIVFRYGLKPLIVKNTFIIELILRDFSLFYLLIKCFCRLQ